MSEQRVAARSRASVVEPLWFEWLARVGLFVFASWLQGGWMPGA